jgi:hypothetical protein
MSFMAIVALIAGPIEKRRDQSVRLKLFTGPSDLGNWVVNMLALRDQTVTRFESLPAKQR